VYAATPDAVSGQIAAHYEQAGDKEKAIIFYRRAAGAARRVFANAEAGAALVSALALADPDQAEHRLRLYEDLADIRVLMGQGEAALEAYQHALAHTVASESVMKARLHRKMGAAQQVNGHHEAALLECIVAESALGQPEPAEDTAWWQEWAQIQIQRCGILYWTNQWPEVARIIEQVRPILERYSTPALRLEFYHTVAQHQLRSSRYVISDELIAHKREVVAAAHELENPGEIASHIFSLGFCLLWKGEMEAAEERLTSALRLAEQIGHRLIQLQTKTYLSILARKRNQVEQAQRLAEHCLVEAEAMQRREYVSVAQATLAWAAWREKRRAEAQTLAQAALDGWRAWTVPYPFWHLALWPLIGVGLQQGNLPAATDHVRRLLLPHQQPPPESLLNLLEDVLRAWEHSQPEAAHEHLTRAVGMAKDLGYL
jgi:tetratricopeptide (TPR) repeat protein